MTKAAKISVDGHTMSCRPTASPNVIRRPARRIGRSSAWPPAGAGAVLTVALTGHSLGHHVGLPPTVQRRPESRWGPAQLEVADQGVQLGLDAGGAVAAVDRAVA